MVQGTLRRGLILACLLLVAAGCSPGRRGPDTGDPAASGDLPAVRALTTSAMTALAEGQFEEAAADLERALRLQPGNAGLWFELARVRQAQGQFAEAESLALRSNSLATDEALVRRNWELIADSRRARGDEAGAREALERAGG